MAQDAFIARLSKMPPPKKPQNAMVLRPSLGLYYSAPSWTLDPRALEDCLNVRIKNGAISSFDMGWDVFQAAIPSMNGPVTFIDSFFSANTGTLTQYFVAATPTSVYRIDPVAHTLRYLNPVNIVGTVAVAGTAVTGTGTFWQSVPNTPVKAGDLIHFSGSPPDTDPSLTWFVIQSVNSDTSITLTSNAGSIGAGAAFTIQKLFTGTQDNRWHAVFFPNADVLGTGASFADLFYMTNGKEYPMYWSPAAVALLSLHDVAPAAPFGFKAQNVAHWKNMLIWLNINPDGGPLPLYTSFINSDVGRPNNYSGGLAGQFIVTPDEHPLQAAVLLGDDLMFYTDNEIVDASFIGSPGTFAFRRVITNKGVVAPDLIANFPDFHHFLSDDCMYWFNGASATPVDAQVWRTLCQRLDRQRLGRSFVTFDRLQGDLIWAVCMVDDPVTTFGPNFAWSAHYLEGVGNVAQPYLFSVHPFPYTKRDYAFCSSTGAHDHDAAQATSPSGQYRQTWADYTQNWITDGSQRWARASTAPLGPMMLAGGAGGRVFTMYTNSSNASVAGTPIVSFAKFPRRLLTDLRHRSLLRRVYVLGPPVGSGAYPLLVTATLYDQADGPAIGGTTQNFDLTLTGNHFVAPYKRGRFFQVQFGTIGATPNGVQAQPWTLEGYDVDVELGGER